MIADVDLLFLRSPTAPWASSNFAGDSHNFEPMLFQHLSLTSASWVTPVQKASPNLRYPIFLAKSDGLCDPGLHRLHHIGLEVAVGVTFPLLDGSLPGKLMQEWLCQLPSDFQNVRFVWLGQNSVRAVWLSTDSFLPALGVFISMGTSTLVIAESYGHRGPTNSQKGNDPKPKGLQLLVLFILP